MTLAAGRRPAEVARELGVSPSTLRRWSQQFGDLLSPEAGTQTSQLSGKITHRRYASADVETLQRVRGLMQEGLTAEEIRTRMVVEFTPEPEIKAVLDEEEEELIAEILADENQTLVLDSELDDVVDIGRLVSDTLESLSDSQQIILGGQQTARQLLGVLLQDNFNLKEENVRLRERMVDTERRVFEIKRELDGNRSMERDRMRQMEAQLFELQRRLDTMAQQRASIGQPVAAQAVQPVIAPPAPVPVVVPAQILEPEPIPAVAITETPNPVLVDESVMLVEEPVIAVEPELQPEDVAAIAETGVSTTAETDVQTQEEVAVKKRGFWDWLWGK